MWAVTDASEPRPRGDAPCDSFVVPRAAQYACALAGAALSRSGDSSETLSRLQHLEAHLSLGRKRE